MDSADVVDLVVRTFSDPFSHEPMGITAFGSGGPTLLELQRGMTVAEVLQATQDSFVVAPGLESR